MFIKYLSYNYAIGLGLAQEDINHLIQSVSHFLFNLNILIAFVAVCF